jgi:hypothetical protein
MRSRFELWWCFGWPYGTSVAMARLVFAGLFDHHPGLKTITHHLGGMVPFFDKRIENGLAVLGSRMRDEDYSRVLGALKRPHIEYFKMFYADTALFGASHGLACASISSGRRASSLPATRLSGLCARRAVRSWPAGLLQRAAPRSSAATQSG